VLHEGSCGKQARELGELLLIPLNGTPYVGFRLPQAHRCDLAGLSLDEQTRALESFLLLDGWRYSISPEPDGLI
jgi:hypothetical protein